MTSNLGTAPDRTTLTPPLKNAQEIKTNDSYSKATPSNNSGWTALWPQEQPNNIVNAIPDSNPVTSANGYASSQASSKNLGTVFTSASNHLPINPFTGTFAKKSLIILGIGFSCFIFHRKP